MLTFGFAASVPAATGRNDRARPVVVCGPSGSGKTTLVQAAATLKPEIFRTPVSVTTRSPRLGEVDGVDYRFISDAAFDDMVLAGQLAEWAVYADSRYGTPSAELSAADGRVPLLVLDLDGMLRLKQQLPQLLSVFLSGPLSLLEKRLLLRGDEPASIVRRLAVASTELLRGPRVCDVTLDISEADLVSRLAALASPSGDGRSL